MNYSIPEGFKIIPSFPNFGCNKEGKIFSTITGKYRKIYVNSFGNHRVTLEKDNKSSGCRSLASIVCETFNGECPYNVKMVSYKDLDINNIHADNLYWKDQYSSKISRNDSRAKFLSRSY